MTGRLDGKVAIVTGAGSVGPGWGNGRATAVIFAREGARVLAVDLDEKSLRDTVDMGAGISPHLCDVTDSAAVAGMVAACQAEFGRVDILVNNVGGTFQAPFLDIAEKGWDALIRTNLKSVFHGVRAVAPRMIARGRGGSIINVVSIEGARAAPLFGPYAACKAAVINFTQTTALELGGHGIRVNAIAPDICLTEGLTALLPETEPTRYRHLVPLGRPAVPEDIAGAAVFLASDLAGYVTGVTLFVDGGTHAAAGWYRDPESGDWILGPPRGLQRP